MTWFGPSWGAPINDDCPQAEAPPSGTPCFDCEEPFESSDSGVTTIAVSGSEGTGYRGRRVAWHLECWQVQAIPCDERHPFEPGMSRREWARLSVRRAYGRAQEG